MQVSVVFSSEGQNLPDTTGSEGADPEPGGRERPLGIPTMRLGRLTEIIDGLAATAALEVRAKKRSACAVGKALLSRYLWHQPEMTLPGSQP
jgi:hypothetical protein